ncbi:pirin-like C-terminal cupin domain-containing protein [uncultured Algoriphagus sp.]|uniref:pirin family protein n=1 Tax=uncultured Algoriphagus sp. TaxID=417365 RepID=UPI0030EE811C|tara:strand:- start:5910 stop:6773 length:864 start_codon:yes stop_codon:yes gene_type:complete
MIHKKIAKVYTPASQQGFLGAGHIARSIITGPFADTDPFIFLMDDMLDKKDYLPVGGPHPHAGFETVSLLIDGEIKEQLESMEKGDFQVMTAGSGIIHTETIDAPTKGRLFQMWLNLPKSDRWVPPRLQILASAKVPICQKDGVSMRLYSGSLAGISSPVKNYTPLITAEFDIVPLKSHSIHIPADFNTFLYVLSGSLSVDQQSVIQDQVAWFDIETENLESEITVNAGPDGVRFVLYSAKPTHDEIVSYGPFIAGSEEEISDLYREFRKGKMHHIADVEIEQRIVY